ncbi:predicted protein [Nematostella vectensis]|uniref:26S proteasome non-ATPase regulatory subunit 5 n=1 Tax=Nematostella vectensis TaxID=45351 RepID=A7SP09_NEMVE|nr:26S proteasome non-ATPase regulatory subunit 5 [Nematostella vectensis]EDO34558.1 predicted protein [Nematostella vectensis]|eukprot:XP_001626658.1 predicted protein [Nematostella vectensis]
MAAEKCKELVENISNASGDEIVAFLRDLSVLISSSPNIRDLASLIPSERLFNCLRTTNTDQITYCKNILKNILKFEKPDAPATKYHDAVIEGLNHPTEDVRELCLIELERCSGTVNGVLALMDKEDLLSYIARGMADEHLKNAQIASNVFTNLAKHEAGLKVLFDSHLQSEFNALLKTKDTVRMRVYDMYITVQAHSPKAFDVCKESGIFEKLISELDGRDVLVQMNCLELLTKLASISPSGLEYLDQKGVVTKLNNLLLEVETDPLITLIIPGIIKFFGTLATAHPLETTQQYPQFLEQTYSMISCGDPTLMPIAMETIGVIAHSEDGLRAVFNNQGRNKHIMKTIFGHATSSQVDLRKRALEALASIFYSEQLTPSEELCEFAKVLYKNMAAAPLEAIFTVAKQPFEELRCSALCLLRSLARYQWALQDMINCPGFLEYLLDRRTEFEKSGKEHKYDLIKELVHFPPAKQIFDRPYFLRLQEYEREGPFFARAEAAVAFEGAD